MKKIFLNYYAAITTLVVFIVYLLTLAPGILQIDSGELAAVEYTLGIAHPTGYPLFTLLGFLFTHAAFFIRPILASNLLAAIYCALSVYFFIRISKLLLDAKSNKPAGKKKKIKKTEISEIPEIVKVTCSVSGALILAFSRTFWFQSASVEVYSLHIFLLSITIFFLIKSFFIQIETKEFNKYWLYATLFLALGFANHMTTLLILPGFAILFFSGNRGNKNIIRNILQMAAVFIPILVVIYLYLPLRASQSPSINWGNTIDFERFWRHFTGKQYQVWLFSSADSAKEQLAYFGKNLLPEFTYTALIPFLLGLSYSYKRSKQIFYFLLISLLFTIFYSINYDIVDIDSYFLLAYFSISLFAVFGLVKLFEILHSKSLSYKMIIPILALFPILELIGNFTRADQSDVYVFEDYTREILESVEENSIILTYQWDYFLSPAYYLQQVENVRKDVILVDKELLRRSWYYDQLKNNYPGIFNGLENTVNSFLEALEPFERGEKYNSKLLESLYRKIITGIISNNFDQKNIYLAPELVDRELKKNEISLPPGFGVVPHRYLFKATNDTAYVSVKPEFGKIRFPKENSHYSDFIKQVISVAFSNRALYEKKYGNINETQRLVEFVKEINPAYRLPVELQ